VPNKTLEQVRNEFQTHLLDNNLIRGVIATAAQHSGKSPWEISFNGTLQMLGQLLPVLLSRISSEAWCEVLLIAVALHYVGDRPDRFEPRLRKRRPKPYKHLRKPRRNYKP
jgi:putative transposase